MAGNVKGITIQFRGETTELDEAIRKINKEIKSTDDELKKVNTALKFNPGNVDLWKQKQELLTKKINETNEKLDILRDTQKKVDAGQIEMTADEYRELQREIITTESKLKTFETQLRKIGNANLKALSEQLKKIGNKMAEVGKSMTTKVTTPIVAGYTLASKYASDYEENLNKLDVAFGDNSDSVKKWAETAREQFGLSKVQATDAASAFGALGKGIGLTEGEAADMSTTLAGLSADLGSYFNVGVDESAKALEGIFTGESEALKKFGVVMTDTNLKQFAEDQGLVYSELSQTEKTMLRYNYVLAKTKDAQGDFSRTSDGTANTLKIFQASLQDLGTAIGTNLLPIITPVIQKITELLNKFNELSPRTQKIITIIGLVAAAIGPVLVVLGTLISSIGAVIGAIGLITAPMLGIAALIAVVIAAGIALYKNWDVIKAKAIQLKDKVVKTFNDVKAKVTAIWTNIKTSVSNAVNTMVTAVTSRINALKNKVSSVFNAIKTAITHPIETAVNIVRTAIDKIKNIINNAHLSLPKFKLPHFRINGGKLPWGIGGKGTPPSINVDWYAKGGIFTSPTIAGIGEIPGGEAVVPLDKFWDKLDHLQGETNIVININGANKDPREIAEEVKRVLIRETNQRRLAWQ